MTVIMIVTVIMSPIDGVLSVVGSVAVFVRLVISLLICTLFSSSFLMGERCYGVP